MQHSDSCCLHNKTRMTQNSKKEKLPYLKEFESIKVIWK